MSVYSSLASVNEELRKCMKCGNCQAVCPIYKETRREVGVARGKISLVESLLSGDMDMTAGLVDRFSLCTTCMACNANCPCGVRFDKIILAARAEAVRKKGLPPVKKAAFRALKMRRLFNAGMKAGSLFQGLVLKRVPGRSHGATLRFEMGLGKERIFPNLAKKTLRDQLQEVTNVEKPRMRVAFSLAA